MLDSPSRPINQILAALPEEEYQWLALKLTKVNLPRGTVLYESLDEIETVYFPNEAIVSLVSYLEDGSTTEVGIVGRNSLLGLPIILGGNRSHHRALIQLPGSLTKISAEVIKREFYRGGKLQKLLLLSAEHRITQISQLAICNRHHTVEQRLARWLLQVRSLIQCDELPLTQEFLAKMLGVRRASVTVTAQNLQKAGAIVYSRGSIIIINLQLLEEISCECYEFQRADFYRLFGSMLPK
ncbi:Crp/Fnr family transcriptional regulator [Myxosarcina sp. GI1(2024)]